jgi:CDP-paratose 2-epimerase
LKALITGSCGLVGYAASRRLLDDGFEIVGSDNDERSRFFGAGASTAPMAVELSRSPRYRHVAADVRDAAAVAAAFGAGVDLVIHAAAQPSHDWATTHIREDFAVNALGTMNVLEAWRASCPTAPLIHCSTSKVYGDNPNRLPFIERATRFDLPEGHPTWHGIPEEFRLDECLHSFFGVSKLAGDLLAPEYGNHFGLPVGIFRPGCITGGHHQGAELHGFLNYMMRCVRHGIPYRVFGHNKKQVRCNVHADDLVDAFLRFAERPRPGAVYNIGGRSIACSLLEALAEGEERGGREAIVEYIDRPRTGDHVWWISDARKLERDYGWRPRRGLDSIFDELFESAGRGAAAAVRPDSIFPAEEMGYRRTSRRPEPARSEPRIVWTEISV